MSSKTTTRTKLRDELTKRFVPALRELGFEGPDRIAGNAPFQQYRPKASDGIHCLAVNFDKWQRPRFALDLRIEPLTGSDAELFRGRAVPGWGRDTESWFRADRPWWHILFGLTSTREHQAVSSAIEMIPEIERCWHDRKATKHISVIFSSVRPQNDTVA